jgi:hypothetical protein
MPWQFVDGPAVRMRLLHSLAIPNGLKSRERCCSDDNLRSTEFGNLNVQNQIEGVDQ